MQKLKSSKCAGVALALPCHICSTPATNQELCQLPGCDARATSSYPGACSCCPLCEQGVGGGPDDAVHAQQRALRRSACGRCKARWRPAAGAMERSARCVRPARLRRGYEWVARAASPGWRIRASAARSVSSSWRWRRWQPLRALHACLRGGGTHAAAGEASHSRRRPCACVPAGRLGTQQQQPGGLQQQAPGSGMGRQQARCARSCMHALATCGCAAPPAAVAALSAPHLPTVPLPLPAGCLLPRLPAAASRRSLSAMAVAAPAAVQAPSFAKEAHGFELVTQQFVKEYDSHVLLYKHKKTGEGRASSL